MPAEQVAGIEIVQCFRIGKPTSNQVDNRGILVKSLHENDAQTIISAAVKKLKVLKEGYDLICLKNGLKAERNCTRNLSSLLEN